MRDSQPKKRPAPGNRTCFPFEERHELVISRDLSLVHDSCVHQGKTGGMDKGLFLCLRGRLCAGESAGFGLPVWKTDAQTFFPTLRSMEITGTTAIHKVFSLDRVIVWRISGIKAPERFARIMERLVDAYMKKTAMQGLLLKVRDTAFSLFRVRSSMEPCKGQGFCDVTYEAAPQGMQVHVQGRLPENKGSLIMLNEADGTSFSALRTGNDLLEGKGIPAWKRASFHAAFESPILDIGFSVWPGKSEDPSECTVFSGRELGYGLDWAGISLMNAKESFTYEVRFKSLKG